MPDEHAQVRAVTEPSDSSRLVLAACDVVQSLPRQPSESWEDIAERLTRNATDPHLPYHRWVLVEADAMVRLIQTLLARGALD